MMSWREDYYRESIAESAPELTTEQVDRIAEAVAISREMESEYSGEAVASANLNAQNRSEVEDLKRQLREAEEQTANERRKWAEASINRIRYKDPYPSDMAEYMNDLARGR